jgi:hypothetical protein
MAFDPSFNNGNTSESRYDAAVHSNIQRNAAKGALKRWLAEGEDHQELHDWLAGRSEYATDYDHEEETKIHPLRENIFAGDFGKFLLKLSQTLVGDVNPNHFDEEVKWWGKLSEKQTDVVRKALARAKDNYARKEELKAEWAEQSAKREHVGEVGDKKFFVDGTISFVRSFEGKWGITYLTLIRDADDNTIKYMGKRVGEKDQKVTMTATVKAHEEYNGEKQTVVNRPRDIKVDD